MNFLIVLFLALVQRNWPGPNPLRELFEPGAWFHWIGGILSAPVPRYLAAVVAPAVLLWILLDEMDGFLLGFVYVVVSVAVVFYSVDIIDLDAAFDDQGVWLRGVKDEDNVVQLEEDQDHFRASLSYDIFQGLFAVIFWFLVLGPAGALLYRLTQSFIAAMDDDEHGGEALDQWLFWLEWLPARITVLLFGLFGDFSRSVDLVTDAFTDTRDDAMIILGHVTAACIASDTAEDVEDFRACAADELMELQQLLERAVWGWVGVAAILTLIGA